MESPTHGLTVDHVLWYCKETEETKREMRMTPEESKRGEEGMRKIVEYTRKIGFYDGVRRTEVERNRHNYPSYNIMPKNKSVPNQKYPKVHFQTPIRPETNS
jgi:hypothetical protein